MQPASREVTWAAILLGTLLMWPAWAGGHSRHDSFDSHPLGWFQVTSLAGEPSTGTYVYVSCHFPLEGWLAMFSLWAATLAMQTCSLLHTASGGAGGNVVDAARQHAGKVLCHIMGLRSGTNRRAVGCSAVGR